MNQVVGILCPEDLSQVGIAEFDTNFWSQIKVLILIQRTVWLQGSELEFVRGARPI